MGRSLRLIMVALFALAAFAVAPLLAQEDDEKSAFIKYVEEQISSDNFKISLNGIEGTLSSDVSLQSITIADRDGIWLTITQPRLIWSRTSLPSMIWISYVSPRTARRRFSYFSYRRFASVRRFWFIT